ncbi:unnamed protein product [Albugo candida]|uniref:Uncharacterized protein n=1 Tax=Albugo candida TaxID=65357 RepID=A0A024GUL0_9STRA|nr:unnamed protein product [Albugo candida]|eukprot:CCI50297.1 unnamed protein product [Albugo candida]
MKISQLKVYCIGALGAWAAYLQSVCGDYMILEKFETYFVGKKRNLWGLKVEIVQIEPKKFIMAFYLDGSNDVDETLQRCLPGIEVGNFVDNGYFTYKICQRREFVVVEGISYYKPASKEHREGVNLIHTSGCWEINLSKVEKLHYSAKLNRMQSGRLALNPDDFIDLAQKGVYSFSTKHSSSISEYAVERMQLTDGSKFRPGPLTCTEIKYGDKSFSNQKIAVQFGNHRIKIPEEVYGRIQKIQHDLPDQNLELGEIDFERESSDGQDGPQFHIKRNARVIRFSEFVPINDRNWVIGVLLLDICTININTQGVTRTYQIFPGRQPDREVSTSTKGYRCVIC